MPAVGCSLVPFSGDTRPLDHAWTDERDDAGRGEKRRRGHQGNRLKDRTIASERRSAPDPAGGTRARAHRPAAAAQSESDVDSIPDRALRPLAAGQLEKRRRNASTPAGRVCGPPRSAQPTGRFSVVGMSGGGPYALACARRIPERLVACGIVSGVGPVAVRHDCTTAAPRASSPIVLRPGLACVLRDDHQSKQLRPLGDDVADDLPSLAVHVAVREGDDPPDPRERQHQR